MFHQASHTFFEPNFGGGDGYRFAFNGKEKDSEGMGGGGSTYDYGFRIYNAQLGRFLSIDPLSSSFPWYTPYQFAGNKTTMAIDLDGLEEWIITREINLRNNTVISTLKYNPGHTGEGVQYSFIIVNNNSRNNLGSLTLNNFIQGTNDEVQSNSLLPYWEDRNDSKSNDLTKVKYGKLGANGQLISQNKWSRGGFNKIGYKQFSTKVPSLIQYYDTDKSHPTNIDAFAIAGLLISNPIITIKIEGYTDSKNPESYNLELSRNRAVNLMNAIVEAARNSGLYSEQQIANMQSRITVEGKGECDAQSQNGDEVEDPKFRKTTITITNDGL